MNVTECPSQSLREPWYWTMTSHIRNAVLEGMKSRAKVELDQVAEGTAIEMAHGEAVQTCEEYERLTRGASFFLRLLGRNVEGNAADLGSGTGVGACILSKFRGVKEVFAIDYSETFVEQMMPLVFERFKASAHKIQRIVGDFNALQFEDETIDVIMEIGAFHHSEKLDLTLENCSRIMRPQGLLIAIDRAWPDHYTEGQLSNLLDQELPPHLKRKYGIPENSPFSRRDWGEHEYTVGQMLKMFLAHGFDAVALIQGYPKIRGINRVLRKLPLFQLSLILAAVRYRLGTRKISIYGFAPQRVVFIGVKRTSP
jgi:ubiquinone/menaquinone biosynthesis C-methylase UbiE